MCNGLSNIPCNNAAFTCGKLTPMPVMHPTMARLYKAAADLRTISGQSELARELGMSPQRLNNWESRGISQEGANLVQAELGINSTWILTGNGEMVVAGHAPTSERMSQSQRPDFGKVSGAVYVLRRYLAIVGDPEEWVTDPVLLEVAYEIVHAFGRDVAPDNVIDLTQALAERLRHQGGTLHEGRKVRRTSSAAG